VVAGGRLRALAFAVLAAAGAAAWASAPPGTGAQFVPVRLTEAEVKTFLAALQGAVMRNDGAAVAKLVHYPVRVYWDNRRVHFGTEKAFAARYLEIFDVRLRRAVLDERGDALVAGENGVLLAGGALLVVGVCEAPATGPCRHARAAISAVSRHSAAAR